MGLTSTWRESSTCANAQRSLGSLCALNPTGTQIEWTGCKRMPGDSRQRRNHRVSLLANEL